MIQLREKFTSDARGKRCSICLGNLRPLNDGDRTGPTERSVDTGIHIDFEGEFEICEHCAIEIGHAVNLVDPGEVEKLRFRVEAAERNVAQLEEALEIKARAVEVFATELADAAHRATIGFAEGYNQAYEEVDQFNREYEDDDLDVKIGNPV
jgi:hypothetical protein